VALTVLVVALLWLGLYPVPILQVLRSTHPAPAAVLQPSEFTTRR
jgi:NADH:ubiquinone oxidoreductase subunit 4 (subunit M)